MLDTVTGGTQAGYANLRCPGFIQDFGVLLAVHPKTLRILSASENIDARLGLKHAAALGASLTDMIDAGAAAEIRAASDADDPIFQNPVPVRIGGRDCDAVLHARDGLILAEIEPRAPGAPGRDDLDRLNEQAIMGMIVPGDLEARVPAGPESIRDTTGFDRVMLYRFDGDFHGQVVGESRAPGIDGFMGLFFPESDIGLPARQLYQENFCRYIPQIRSPLIRILPSANPLSGKPIDMSGAVLRGVAPCHMEYLVNMGVAASMSFSIVVEGQLWGLFACHHYTPAQLSYTQRLVCEQIAMLFAARLSELGNPAHIQAALDDALQRVLAVSPLLGGNPLGAAWKPEDETALLAVVQADGAAIYWEGNVGQIGQCPDLAPLHAHLQSDPAAFDRLVRLYDDAGLFHTSSVASATPFGTAMRERGSGMLIVPLSRSARRYLIFFRPEQVVNTTWAGNPGSPHGNDLNARFSPRKSFAAWKEDIRDRAAAWTAPQIANAASLRDAILAREV